jgi:hypothetical protein
MNERGKRTTVITAASYSNDNRDFTHTTPTTRDGAAGCPWGRTGRPACARSHLWKNTSSSGRAVRTPISHSQPASQSASQSVSQSVHHSLPPHASSTHEGPISSPPPPTAQHPFPPKTTAHHHHHHHHQGTRPAAATPSRPGAPARPPIASGPMRRTASPATIWRVCRAGSSRGMTAGPTRATRPP